jgi:hypothetical protein
MKNLGKILLLLFLIPHAVVASVVATLSEKSVSVGDMVSYNLTLTGENIQRPQINILCGSDIISTASQTSIQMVNGDYKKSYILSYKFMPQKSCEIKPIEVEIDGKTEVSNGVSLEVKAMRAAKDADFILTLESDKEEVFVGEPFSVTLVLKQKKGAQAVDSKFVAPELKGFWIKSESDPVRSDNEEYTITTLEYLMSAQRDGNVTISPAQMRIASRSSSVDSWGAWVPNIKWKSYFSNKLDLKVQPLPAGVSLVGDFTIEATADKSEINANEAVNVTLKVKGDGNLEDIKSFKPYIDGVSVFDEKIVLNKSILTQKMAFVSDTDFTIAPFSLKYFNPQTKEIQTISSKAIDIKVKNAKPKEELVIKREEKKSDEAVVETTSKELSLTWIVLGFFIGLACGIVLTLLKPWKLFKREKTVSIKDPKILLVKLLPYKNDAQVQEIIDILECLKRYKIS